ncbi:hypothetical protein BTHI11S_03312 [Bosea thiooxidans]
MQAEVADQGLDLELIGHNGLRERFPWIDGSILGASLCAGDGHANPRLVSAGFASAARRAGVLAGRTRPLPASRATARALRWKPARARP